jgi:hypothetical protein
VQALLLSTSAGGKQVVTLHQPVPEDLSIASGQSSGRRGSELLQPGCLITHAQQTRRDCRRAFPAGNDVQIAQCHRRGTCRLFPSSVLRTLGRGCSISQSGSTDDEAQPPSNSMDGECCVSGQMCIETHLAALCRRRWRLRQRELLPLLIRCLDRDDGSLSARPGSFSFVHAVVSRPDSRACTAFHARKAPGERCTARGLSQPSSNLPGGVVGRSSNFYN